MPRQIHPLIGNTSWGLGMRCTQLVFAGLVLGLSAYTLSQFTGWKQVRFTVAVGAWGVISVLWLASSGMSYRPRSHFYLTLTLEILNWFMFLAAWIALAEQISCDTAQCAAPGGGHLHIRPCDSIYAAFAFAIVEWILFTTSLVLVTNHIRFGRDETRDAKGERTGV